MADNGKAQSVRVLDVALIGPAVIAGGVLLTKKGSPKLGGVLAVIGIGTIAYNAHNFFRVEGKKLSSRRSFELRPYPKRLR